MSSSKRTPFQDITNEQNKDPKEAERRRKREWYARNKEEILKRRRQARELKKQKTTPIIEDNTLSHTPATGPSGVTQIQYRTPAEDVSHVVQQNYASQITTPNSSQFHADAGVESTMERSNRQRIARQQKRAVVQSAVNCKEWSQTPANGVYAYASPKCIDHHSQVTQQPYIEAIGSSYSGGARDLTTPCNKAVMVDEDHGDWLRSNLTYMRDVRSVNDLHNVSTSAWLHGQESFAEKCAYSEKKRQSESSEQKRQRERERYSLTTDEQKDIWLQNNQIIELVLLATDLGDTNNDEDFDTTRIFEPVEQEATFEDNLDAIQEEQTVHDDDEECRIFSGTGDVFDSYQVRSGVAPSNQNDDPYDYVYHNLPTKHHVLKTVKDCIYCGAMRLQYEGPAFCCKKGKVKIVTPEVPQELRRLFTSQVDEDAKYFKKHI
uniref:Uncharacterized protein n=1 Tax=Avena sativa TaxID=4498 RepID=A0ACD5UJD4_AVESA